MQLEGVGKLKKKKYTSSGLQPATFRFVAQYLNQLRYCVTLLLEIQSIYKCAADDDVQPENILLSLR
jgi:hypothetical protein